MAVDSQATARVSGSQKSVLVEAIVEASRHRSRKVPPPA